jgi:protein gp37
MGDNSAIEWCDATWNPVRGCSRVSEGCRNCYAEIMAARFSGPGMWGAGFAQMVGGDHRWTGKVELIESQLDLPLRWRAPRRIFVNSTSDLFHEAVPEETIARVFNVMAECPQHTFQVLTKRAGRMRAIMGGPKHHGLWSPKLWHRSVLPNVWLGVSAEDQQRADERVHDLRLTPAAVRFVSAEPLLGPIDFTRLNDCGTIASDTLRIKTGSVASIPPLDWIIVGGESGPGARPMQMEWAGAIVDQCRDAGVACFVKQMGENPTRFGHPAAFKDRKGGDIEEWPAGYRVREFPEAARG